MLNRAAVACFLALSAVGLSGHAARSSPVVSTFTITIDQVGSDVVVTGSGSINEDGLTQEGTAGSQGGVNSRSGYLSIGSADSVGVNFFTGATSAIITTGSGSFTPVTSGSGTLFTMIASLGYIYLPVDYVSGDTINDTSTYADTTIAALGLVPGQYTLTWSSGSVLVTIEGSAVPEPSTVAMLTAPLMLFVALRRRNGFRA